MRVQAYKRAYAWILLILANVLFATGYIAAKFVLQSVPVIMALALRLGMAALVLLPVLLLKRKELRITRRDLFQLGVLVLAGFVLNNLLEYGGLALTTASDFALLVTSESIFTAILSWIFLRERFKGITVLALLVGSAGMYLIIERSLLPTFAAGAGALRTIGDLLILLGLVAESCYTVYGKALLVKNSPLLIVAASLIGSMVFWIPATGTMVLTTGWHPLNLPSWLALGWLALMSTVLAYLAWFQGLTKIEGSSAAATLFVQPLVGTLLAVLLLHDQLTPMTAVGGLLIVGSVYLISR
jgi:drug/metabolite transporter (DMT)-like permease